MRGWQSAVVVVVCCLSPSASHLAILRVQGGKLARGGGDNNQLAQTEDLAVQGAVAGHTGSQAGQRLHDTRQRLDLRRDAVVHVRQHRCIRRKRLQINIVLRQIHEIHRLNVRQCLGVERTGKGGIRG